MHSSINDPREHWAKKRGEEGVYNILQHHEGRWAQTYCQISPDVQSPLFPEHQLCNATQPQFLLCKASEGEKNSILRK